MGDDRGALRPKPSTVAGPATVQDCNDDRANAKGPGAAREQSGHARTQGNNQAGTR